MQVDTVIGKIKFITFSRDDFSIIKVKTDTPVTSNGGCQLSVKGQNLPTNMNLKYRFTGTLAEDSRYGVTMSALSAEPIVEKDKDSIIEYLSSGIFKGIGKTTAKRIYDTFKENSVDIFENHTDELLKVNGIGTKLVEKIKKALQESQTAKLVIKELTPHGITPEQCLKLTSVFAGKTMEVVFSNPYVMMKPLRLPFEVLDPIALSMGVSTDANIRIDAAIHAVFGKTFLEGSTGKDVQTFGYEVVKLLNTHKTTVTVAQIESAIIARVKNGELHTARMNTKGGVVQYIFPNSMYTMEKSLADNLCRIASQKLPPIPTLDEDIAEAEKKFGISLDDVQKDAVKAAFEHPLVVITGGPGTGKTTIMRVIVYIYEKRRKSDVVLLAPTGRASRKLAEYTHHEAYTLHSRLKLYGEETDEVEADVEAVENTCFIADEFSMADTYISNAFVKSVGKGSQAILVGDIDQLPSVGCGAVLRDIINSSIAHVIRLTHIFRADADSNIYQNTVKINSGDAQLLKGKDFHLHDVADMESARNLMTELYVQRVKEYGITNVMLLVPYRKNYGGVIDLNQHLQEIINPPDPDKHEYKYGGVIYREGDLCMHVRKNTEEASNGDLGIIRKVCVEDRKVEILVSINGHNIFYDKEKLECLDLAYAMTIHKSQGSEAKAVITCITKGYPAMLYRSIPYVAVSRGKLEVDLIKDETFEKTINTIRSNDRITLLPYFLKKYSGEYVLL